MRKQQFVTMMSVLVLGLAVTATAACQASQSLPASPTTAPVISSTREILPTPLTITPASQPTPASADPAETIRAGFNVSGWV